MTQCEATRTAKVNDPAVTVTRVGHSARDGVRTCGRCGREGVKVSQSLDSQGSRYRAPTGAPMTAWYYERHDVPESEGRES